MNVGCRINNPLRLGGGDIASRLTLLKCLDRKCKTKETPTISTSIGNPTLHKASMLVFIANSDGKTIVKNSKIRRGMNEKLFFLIFVVRS